MESFGNTLLAAGEWFSHLSASAQHACLAALLAWKTAVDFAIMWWIKRRKPVNPPTIPQPARRS